MNWISPVYQAQENCTLRHAPQNFILGADHFQTELFVAFQAGPQLVKRLLVRTVHFLQNLLCAIHFILFI
jgi:hypothetical protein